LLQEVITTLLAEDFAYDLPEELIAQEPIAHREKSRLLVLDRKQNSVEHRVFKDVVEYLQPGDVLVLNDSRVIPARLWAKRSTTGGKVETLLLKPLGGDLWEVLVKPGRRAPVGEQLVYGNGELVAKIIDKTEAGGRILEFAYENSSFRELIERLGEVPLPPYIRKKLHNRERYQTVYARKEGSVAAPTAGLHFTQELLEEIENKGIKICYLTLHVGLGTFRPVLVENILEHKMHTEFYELGSEVAGVVNHARSGGGRVFAVGTTVVRVLESVGKDDGILRPDRGWTDLFIYPGFKFRIVDAMLTNFHLPKSTLLMLVSAFAGRERVLSAYEEAIRAKYRFFSFGDAMLIL
jgi:S-adenosylmethionine:tRNA ribosyltransferase-isomerase